jgi:hypothetical protein
MGRALDLRIFSLFDGELIASNRLSKTDRQILIRRDDSCGALVFALSHAGGACSSIRQDLERLRR